MYMCKYIAIPHIKFSYNLITLYLIYFQHNKFVIPFIIHMYFSSLIIQALCSFYTTVIFQSYLKHRFLV